MPGNAPSLVLDCSVAVAWCFEDEASPALDLLQERVRDEGAAVPAFWYLEVANVLVQATRRGRIDVATARAQLAQMGLLPVSADTEGAGSVWQGAVMTLALDAGLTAYDATYLELAQRLGLPLATTDSALRKAALGRSVALLPVG